MSLKEAPVNAVSDLQGKKVAVVSSTTTEESLRKILQKSLTDAEVVVVESAAQGAEKLDQGEVAAFSSDQVVLIGMLINTDQPERYLVGGSLFSFEPLALAVRRNDADFRLIADRVLSQLYRTQQIAPIFKKWFGQFSKKVPSAITAAYEINSTPE